MNRTGQVGQQGQNGPGRGKSMCEGDSEAKGLFWWLYIQVRREYESRLTLSIPLWWLFFPIYFDFIVR